MAVKVRDLIRTLENAGWRHVRTSGDHRVFQNPEGRITVVSGNSATTFDPAPIVPFYGKLVSRRLIK